MPRGRDRATIGAPRCGWDLTVHRVGGKLTIARYWAAVLLCALMTVQGFAEGIDTMQLRAQATEEYTRPVRPGIPGERPFWNKYSRRFMYAPAFDFAPVLGAVKYRFTVTCGADGSTHRFEASVPYAALSPVWTGLPIGFATVVCEGVDASGRVLSKAGERRFYRAAMWDGTIPAATRSYGESARLGLRFLFREKHVQQWLASGQPDPNYVLYCYPSKIMGALIQAMLLFSKIAPPHEASSALAIARKVADFLISISYGQDTTYPYFPPTYRGQALAAKRFAGQLMIFYPTRPANAYLDLFDATGDHEYFDAAKRIAHTYAKTQLPSGSWYLKVDAQTGKPVCPNICIPIEMVELFDRLIEQYGQVQYREARDKAWAWIMQNPMRTYNWQGQFEDVQPMPPYRNLARDTACAVANYLFRRFKNDPNAMAQAEELVRFAEDQFVVWAKPVPTRWSNKADWFLPAVLEQYVYYTPIDASAAQMIAAWHEAYRAMGKPIYLAKMRAMANQMTRVQHPDTGQYPTYWRKPRPGSYWLNCATIDAIVMYRIAYLSPQQAGP